MLNIKKINFTNNLTCSILSVQKKINGFAIRKTYSPSINNKQERRLLREDAFFVLVV